MGRKVTAAEMAKHDMPSDCWIAVNGKVYDLTKFAHEHPGGVQVIHDFAGKDGSELYNIYHAEDLIENTLTMDNKKGSLEDSVATRNWIAAQASATKSGSQDNSDKPSLGGLLNLNEFEQVFAQHGNPKSCAYLASASNDLLTLNANKTAWQKLWFRPKILRDVSSVNTRMRMLGVDVSMPVFISPMGIAKTAGPLGEKALGAGAASSGIVHCMSTSASFSIEDILSSVPESYPYYFQLYVDKQRQKTEKMLQRIETLKQIKAIFVTVDLPVVSKREADERVKIGGTDSNGKRGGGVAKQTGSFIDPSLSWSDLAWIRRYSTKPIIVKGIQGAADAKKALDLGCQGIVVSNHGGRALDSAPATVLALLEIRRDCPQAFDKMEVFIDGGIRRGSDVLKAVLLGARGVGIGRPFQCSVMYDQEGVEAVAAILQDELETAMRLCGVTDLDKARGDLSFLNVEELRQMLPGRPKSRFGLFSFVPRL